MRLMLYSNLISSLKFSHLSFLKSRLILNPSQTINKKVMKIKKMLGFIAVWI